MTPIAQSNRRSDVSEVRAGFERAKSVRCRGARELESENPACVGAQRVSRQIRVMSTPTLIFDFFDSVKMTPLTGGTSL